MEKEKSAMYQPKKEEGEERKEERKKRKRRKEEEEGGRKKKKEEGGGGEGKGEELEGFALFCFMVLGLNHGFLSKIH